MTENVQSKQYAARPQIKHTWLSVTTNGMAQWIIKSWMKAANTYNKTHEIRHEIQQYNISSLLTFPPRWQHASQLSYKQCIFTTLIGTAEYLSILVIKWGICCCTRGMIFIHFLMFLAYLRREVSTVRAKQHKHFHCTSRVVIHEIGE